MSIRHGKLYGVITEILPDGKIAKCEPVYTGFDRKNKYYTAVVRNRGLSEFVEIDISQYGEKIFLPADKEKINDGNTYFIVFEPSKNNTPLSAKFYAEFPSMEVYDFDSYIPPKQMSVGILFPNTFVAVVDVKEKSEEELLRLIQ